MGEGWEKDGVGVDEESKKGGWGMEGGGREGRARDGWRMGEGG